MLWKRKGRLSILGNGMVRLRIPAPQSTPSTVRRHLLLAGILSISLPDFAQAQTAPYAPAQLAGFVSDFKNAERGPYAAIRWFCPDGTVIPALQRCTETGGIQHAVPNDIARRILERNGIYLGQILAGTDNRAFLDASRGFSRPRQYELERFLQLADDGWVLRRAQFYRGAFQAEDEEAWGRKFLTETLAADSLVNRHFFWTRRLVRTIPHAASERRLDRIRALAKTISDGYPAFLNIRIKIHGKPDASDLASVRQFMAGQGSKVPTALREELQDLARELETQYTTRPSEPIRRLAAVVAQTSPVLTPLNDFIRLLDEANWPAAANAGGELMITLQNRALSVSSGGSRLLLMDLSLAVEDAVFHIAGAWEPAGVRDVIVLTTALARTAAGAGFLERWEWAQLEPLFPKTVADPPTDAVVAEALTASRRAVEWGIGLASATYGEVVRLYTPFEPLANGFLDDLLRSSIVLPLGAGVSRLAEEHARRTGSNTRILGLSGGGGVRGLNPGFALGQLEVVDDAEDLDLLADRIYIMNRPPSEMKPVAGIATVTEGNVVSHVQLLARNLGIPNAVVTPEVVSMLRAYSGQRVFYAVSPGGSVLIKLATEVTQEERDLVEAKSRSDERVRVPTKRLALDNLTLSPLFDLRSEDSGRLCGPKAANLGQLSSMFPGHVAPGFIIPFGVFKQHMAQTIPGGTTTYWAFLRAAFADVESRTRAGVAPETVEAELLAKLATLRSAIESMPLLPAFRESLSSAFTKAFGTPMGQSPVFIRSDTNMEDLADFSGAGLNLTVPNVVAQNDVLDAVRRVWASPYRERSYSWRQKYLLNPEDVYPSILVLKSVNVAKSGVMITTGISTGNAAEVTIAFSRGVGGAVDGQAAETWLLGQTAETLLSPAREPTFRTLPVSGGTAVQRTGYQNRILTPANLTALRSLAQEVKTRLPQMPGMRSSGPWDVELGFLDGQIWLFQVRPFVENRAAGSTTYLQRMDANAPRATKPQSR
ncbi:MAG: hypothetical protein ACI80V_001540 [Rhodothermales bacterium]|jgi:hypothetical protein